GGVEALAQERGDGGAGVRRRGGLKNSRRERGGHGGEHSTNPLPPRWGRARDGGAGSSLMVGRGRRTASLGFNLKPSACTPTPPSPIEGEGSVSPSPSPSADTAPPAPRAASARRGRWPPSPRPAWTSSAAEAVRRRRTGAGRPGAPWPPSR